MVGICPALISRRAQFTDLIVAEVKVGARTVHGRYRQQLTLNICILSLCYLLKSPLTRRCPSLHTSFACQQQRSRSIAQSFPSWLCGCSKIALPKEHRIGR